MFTTRPEIRGTFGVVASTHWIASSVGMAMLERGGNAFAQLQAEEPEFVHVVLEALKLAFADREAYYGDPDFTRVPLDALLSEDYAAARRKLIGNAASHELRPGVLPGFEAQVERSLRVVRIASNENAGLGCDRGKLW